MKRAVLMLVTLLALAGLARADYLGSWAINDYLPINANTHRLSSGAAYDASSITYRIYEDETAAEIVSDTAMTKFDSETGFYLNRVQLLTATGFEAGKCYTVLIKATVDGVSGTTSHTFQIGLNASKLAGNSLPTSAANVFDDLVTSTGGGTISLDASGYVTLAPGSITSGKFDESTAFPLKSEDAGSTQVARVGAASDTLETLSDQLDALQTDATAILALAGTTGVIVATNNDKTGYKLAPDGLDSVSTAAPSGVPTDFREMMVMVYRRFFKKVTMTSTVLSTYADDGSTVLTEQDLSDPGSLRTTGAAQAP